MPSYTGAFITVLIVIVASCSWVWSETTYDQPYVGTWPSGWDRFTAAGLDKQSQHGLAAKVKAADCIILGSAETLTAIKVSEPVEKIQFYVADVTVDSTLKGKLVQKKLHLTFTPSATSIDVGAQHVFLLQAKEEQSFEVLEAWYVYPGQANAMRVVGAYNCSQDVGMAVLRHLVSGKADAALSGQLLGEYRSSAGGKTYSAVVMAAAVAPDIGKAVLTQVVSQQDQKRFDLDLYGLAAHALAKGHGDAGLQLLLKHIPQHAGAARIPESVVFDLIATHGSDKMIKVVEAYAHGNPRCVVSAAFAMSRIGSQAAKDAITAIIDDKQLASGMETLSGGMQVESVRALLTAARAQCRVKSAAPVDQD